MKKENVIIYVNVLAQVLPRSDYGSLRIVMIKDCTK